MSLLLENPWPVLTAAIGLELVLAVLVARTGQAKLFVVMAAVALMAVVLVLIERLVVTDREQIEDALAGIASGLVKNDPEAVLVFVSPQATQIQQTARSVLPQVTI